MGLRDVFSQWKHKNASSTQIVAQPIDDEVIQTPYYREISLRYASAQLVLYMMLGVFLLVTLLTGTDRLSIENMTYFIKDLNTSVFLPQEGVAEYLTYPSDDSNEYALYRGGLAVLGKENLTVFTATGRQSYTDSVIYNMPRMVSSGRYLLTYDLGGNEYALYNSFSSIYEGKTDAPVRSAAISDAGYYCIISDGSIYASDVVLYDDMFRPVNTLHLKEYAVCAAICSDGRQMVVASVNAKDGTLTTELALCQSGKEQYETVSIADCYPISIHYTEENVLMLYSTMGLHCLNLQGEILSYLPVDMNTVQSVSLSSQGCLIISAANNYDEATRVMAVDGNGALAFNKLTEERVLDAVLLRDLLCLRFENTVSVYDTEQTLPIVLLPVEGNFSAALAYSSNEILLCGPARAVCIKIDIP